MKRRQQVRRHKAPHNLQVEVLKLQMRLVSQSLELEHPREEVTMVAVPR